MTVAQLLASLPGRELTEWQAYLDHEARVHELIHEKTDPDLAYRMVWGEAIGTDDEGDED